MKKRILELVQLLADKEDYINGNALAQKLDVSSRTLRTDLRQHEQELKENGCRILSRPVLGYRLQIDDPQLFTAFLQQDAQKNESIPQNTQQRLEYIIKALLLSEKKYTVDFFCEELFISRSSFTPLIKEVKHQLEKYALQLVFDQHYYLKGSEQNIRLCLAEYFFHQQDVPSTQPQLDTIFSADIFQQISAIVDQELDRQPLSMTDIARKNLVIHLVIAVLRIKEDDLIHVEQGQYHHLERNQEFLIAGSIAARIEQAFQLVFPYAEIYYVTIHLLGKRTIQELDRHSADWETAELLFEKITTELTASYGISLTEDLQFYSNFTIHLCALITRATYGLVGRNTLLKEIRKNYPFAFELAVFAGKLIESQLETKISEDEIGFLALHLALALETKKSARTFNVLIVCASGRGTSQLLAFKIRQRFAAQIGRLDIVEASDLQKRELADIDYIFSTIELQDDFPVPVIQISNFLEAQDIQAISGQLRQSEVPAEFSDYFSEELFFENADLPNKEAVLQFLVSQLTTDTDQQKNYYHSILQREQLGATEYGNQIALPHPLEPIGETSQVAALSLKKPILWHKKMVRYIFLFSFPKQSEKDALVVTDFLTDLLFDAQSLRQLKKDFSFRSFQHIWNEQTKHKDPLAEDSLFN